MSRYCHAKNPMLVLITAKWTFPLAISPCLFYKRSMAKDLLCTKHFIQAIIFILM